MDNYDYYGNYKNKDEYPLFTVNDLQKKAKSRETNRNKIYFSIAKRCFDKIKETSENDETNCFFKIPEYIPGFPLFNMTETVLYLLNLLQEKGFKCRYVNGYVIYITWTLPKKEYKTIEDKKPFMGNNMNNINNPLNEIHLKYKPVEGNSFKDFIPRKK